MLKRFLACSLLAIFTLTLAGDWLEASPWRRKRGRRRPLIMRRVAAKTRRLVFKAARILPRDHQDFEKLQKTLHDAVKFQLLGQALRGANHKKLAVAFYLKARKNARDVLKACNGKLTRADGDSSQETDMTKDVTDEEMEDAEKEWLPRISLPRIEKFLDDPNLGMGDEEGKEKEKDDSSK